MMNWHCLCFSLAAVELQQQQQQQHRAGEGVGRVAAPCVLRAIRYGLPFISVCLGLEHDNGTAPGAVVVLC